MEIILGADCRISKALNLLLLFIIVIIHFCHSLEFIDYYLSSIIYLYSLLDYYLERFNEYDS